MAQGALVPSGDDFLGYFKIAEAVGGEEVHVDTRSRCSLCLVLEMEFNSKLEKSQVGLKKRLQT